MNAVSPTGMSEHDPALPRLCARVAWRLLPLLFLGMLASYLDRVNVGFAKLRMLSDLSMSEASYGAGAGLFFLGYILCEIPSNALMIRFGARRWLARILITWGICSGAMAFVHSADLFYLLRLLLGVAEAGFMPGVLFYLSQWFPPGYRARVTGWFMVGIPLASVIGGPVSGLILGRMEGAIGIEGWRWLFFLEAMPPVLLGLMVFFCLPDRVENARFLTEREKTLLITHRVMPDHAHVLQGIKAALWDRRIWKLGLADGALLLGLYTIAFWMPSLLHDAGVHSLVRTGVLTAIPNIGAAVAIMLIGWDSDRTGERRWHIIVPILIGALSMALLPLARGNLTLAIMLITLANMGIIGALAPFWALPSLLLTDTATIAAGLALIGGISNLAGFMATGLIGWARSMAPGSWGIFVIFAGFVAMGAALVWSIPEVAVRADRDRT
ncbi:MFS transporter [Komagataeibacter saccharivorans]|uniref:MFS transporter n=1 Tax=Komagataeibacter saccharivorans TaxID=265959 RepID=UPI0039E9000E